MASLAVFAMLVVDKGLDARRTLMKQLWLLKGSFTEAELHSWALDILRGKTSQIPATINVVAWSAHDWPEMSRYITAGTSWAMVTEYEYNSIMIASNAVADGNRDIANRVMARCRMLP